MKKFLTAGAALVGFGLSNLALASDGTITFKGEVSSKTCTIDSNTLNQNVEMPVVSQTSLAPGQRAGAKQFEIRVSACTAGTKVKAHFDAGSTVDAVEGVLKNQSKDANASNAFVQILNKNGDPINLVNGTNNLEEVTGTNNDAVLLFSAAYLAPKVDPIKPGPVLTNVSYTMTYE
ncbi:major type 1 subunit fimbrin (pilin) [Pseudomonas sp. SLBN-26]|jgi:major type 1 subunit fimbrin (pilin)|uniref:Fimbrial protein n=1 Tax=Metapseudomonas otitidis TaxID=319939 RepID=A0A1I0SN57_9GAMM|nr:MULTISPECIES: fimbrial protein [Pseudomonas]MCP1618980.1 major type 1 subunit fimbrin (pilin) [Pseudomonas otitidis]MDI6527007.1 fimbrial protein [Pseudomonas otitidis]MDU9400637.1 fimbrial protein [Pseudomonas sp. zfem003]MWK57924.1 fimbrial protein [Pseudomonas otitidis]TQL08202.1 major type 1 subunit fimbrin (pilin) [Pseudomonas sp. SLBN-26]